MWPVSWMMVQWARLITVWPALVRCQPLRNHVMWLVKMSACLLIGLNGQTVYRAVEVKDSAKGGQKVGQRSNRRFSILLSVSLVQNVASLYKVEWYRRLLKLSCSVVRHVKLILLSSTELWLFIMRNDTTNLKFYILIFQWLGMPHQSVVIWQCIPDMNRMCVTAAELRRS